MSRQYYNYGSNPFCLAHGEGKVGKLPATMLFELRRDHPDWLAKSNTLEVHMGHVHHKQEMEYLALDDAGGVTLRFFRSLTSADKWHFDNKFVGSPKAAEALLWIEAYYEDHVYAVSDTCQT